MERDFEAALPTFQARCDAPPRHFAPVAYHETTEEQRGAHDYGDVLTFILEMGEASLEALLPPVGVARLARLLDLTDVDDELHDSRAELVSWYECDYEPSK